MNARIRFLLAVAVLGLLMTGPFVLTAILLFADAREVERAALIELLAPRLPLGAFMTTSWYCATCSDSTSRGC
jgi:DNA polymerase-3 subunit epsilon